MSNSDQVYRRRSFCQNFRLDFCIIAALSHQLRAGFWFSRLQWLVDYLHKLDFSHSPTRNSEMALSHTV